MGNAARLTGIQSLPTSMTSLRKEKNDMHNVARILPDSGAKEICAILYHTLMHTIQDPAMDFSLAGSCIFYFR